ncbi:MAG: acyl carrier protein [Clostridia bacterium]|nr:acyl carrier protein [Clostridia bacterium]
MYEKTLAKLKEIMTEELDLSADDIKPEAQLVSDLDINSLEFMNVIMVVEETFEVFLDEDRLRKLKTVDDVVNYIVELKN